MMRKNLGAKPYTYSLKAGNAFSDGLKLKALARGIPVKPIGGCL